MGRNRQMVQKYYCPKCEKKELIKTYPSGQGWGHVTWTCGYNAPSAKPWRANCKQRPGPACGLVIKHPDRDAKISDYFNVLDLMSRIGEEIKWHLLENNASIHKRGLEVLYAGELLDLVRLNDYEGLGIYIYAKEGWQGGAELPRALKSRAAEHIIFRDVKLSVIFRAIRFGLWSSKDIYSCSMSPFKGQKMNKKLRAELIDWAAALDAELPALKAQATADDLRWRAEADHLRGEIIREGKGPHVQLGSWNGATRRAAVQIHGWITPEQVKAIADIVRPRSEVTS